MRALAVCLALAACSGATPVATTVAQPPHSASASMLANGVAYYLDKCRGVTRSETLEVERIEGEERRLRGMQEVVERGLGEIEKKQGVAQGTLDRLLANQAFCTPDVCRGPFPWDRCSVFCARPSDGQFEIDMARRAVNDLRSTLDESRRQIAQYNASRGILLRGVPWSEQAVRACYDTTTWEKDLVGNAPSETLRALLDKVGIVELPLSGLEHGLVEVSHLSRLGIADLVEGCARSFTKRDDIDVSKKLFGVCAMSIELTKIQRQRKKVYCLGKNGTRSVTLSFYKIEKGIYSWALSLEGFEEFQGKSDVHFELGEQFIGNLAQEKNSTLKSNIKMAIREAAASLWSPESRRQPLDWPTCLPWRFVREDIE